MGTKKPAHGVDIYCDELSYRTGFMIFKNAIFRINIQVSYFMQDEDNSSKSKCPCCGQDRLNITN